MSDAVKNIYKILVDATVWRFQNIGRGDFPSPKEKQAAQIRLQRLFRFRWAEPPPIAPCFGLAPSTQPPRPSQDSAGFLLLTPKEMANEQRFFSPHRR